MNKFLTPITLSLFLLGCGGGGGGGGGTEPVAANLAPVVIGDEAIEIIEGVQLTSAYSASDPEDVAVTLSLTGADASAMALSVEGNLTFVQVPDFEAPADAGADNVYNVAIVASDSIKETSYAVVITVTNATEGRVVDGPVSGASVHIDLNGDGIQDANESVVLTDAEGNYSLPVPATFPASIVSIGGTDTHTGKLLENIALVSEIRSASAPVAITPLTTVLVGIESEADQAAFLISVGLGSSLDDVLSADGWAAAESGDADAQAAQRISQQIATAMQAISNVIEGSADAGTSAFDISKIVAAKIVAVAQSAEGIDLASAESMQSIIVASVNEVITDGSVDADVLTAVATSIASVNSVLADVSLDPTSASAADIVKSVQDDVQSNIVSLATGEITLAAFAEAVNVVVNAYDTAPLNPQISFVSAVRDLDGDGVPDSNDPDTDNDGFNDDEDAFPRDASEWLDTDGDNIGNNIDTDDDGDGVADGSDAFPLDATETLDTDADGVGDNSDAFPNDAEESIDTDGDQVGDNADNCPNLSNADQLNTDGDIEGDVCDLDDDNDGFIDEEELAAGTDSLGAKSCPGCFNWDIDDDGEAAALTDGLIMIRHMFGFDGVSLSAGAMGAEAGRATPDAISSHLTDANTELDVDGDGESKALTDGLLLIRYLFGFTGDSLISGAIGDGAERDTAEEVEAYIEARLPPSP